MSPRFVRCHPLVASARCPSTSSSTASVWLDHAGHRGQVSSRPVPRRSRALGQACRLHHARVWPGRQESTEVGGRHTARWGTLATLTPSRSAAGPTWTRCPRWTASYRPSSGPRPSFSGSPAPSCWAAPRATGSSFGPSTRSWRSLSSPGTAPCSRPPLSGSTASSGPLGRSGAAPMSRCWATGSRWSPWRTWCSTGEGPMPPGRPGSAAASWASSQAASRWCWRPGGPSGPVRRSGWTSGWTSWTPRSRWTTEPSTRSTAAAA